MLRAQMRKFGTEQFLSSPQIPVGIQAKPDLSSGGLRSEPYIMSELFLITKVQRNLVKTYKRAFDKSFRGEEKDSAWKMIGP